MKKEQTENEFKYSNIWSESLKTSL